MPASKVTQSDLVKEYVQISSFMFHRDLSESTIIRAPNRKERRMKQNKYLVKPGEKVKMKDFDPNDSSEFDGNKKDGKEAS